jgi:hypothetical protein
MSKNKNKTTKGAAKGNDDDWESAFSEAAAVNAAAAPVVVSAPVVDAVLPAAKVICLLFSNFGK